ncbi:flagellar biosynthesis anti-sigma factor FlgM [Photobacterium minamisatsumaniensis]|uniref:flagellar biosynthesis anti-sigma factor FlgM n=1 Tax=Photobacterium minamisatsumaniensis TaxID=2910233 RepID=UPI003D0FA5F7
MIESTKAGLQLATPIKQNLNKAGDTKTVTATDTTDTPSSSPAQTKQSNSTSVVSAQAQNLESLQQELQRMPDVDMAKVNEIRSLLASGNYEIDLDGLAASIRGTHSRD